MQVSAEDDVVDDDEVLLPVVKFGVTVVKNVPVRSKSRMVPSVKPAITKHPDDVAVIDVHSSLMGNDVESPRNDFDVDGIFSHDEFDFFCVTFSIPASTSPPYRELLLVLLWFAVWVGECGVRNPKCRHPSIHFLIQSGVPDLHQIFIGAENSLAA